MQIQKREKWALITCVGAVLLFSLMKFVFFPTWDSLQETRENIPMQEKKLGKYKEVVASVPLRTSEASKVEALLHTAERGLLESKTASLASAELQDLLKQIAMTQSIDFRSSDFLPVKAISADYAEVPIGLQFQCKVDQLANLMRELSIHTKYLRVVRLTIQGASGKEKNIVVGLQVAGMMHAEPDAKKLAR
jgi:hypothetical protein